MLSDDRIRSFTETVVPFLHVTTRIPGKKDDDLLRRMGFSRYPTLSFLDGDGNVLVVLHPTWRSIEGFQRARDAARRIRELLPRVDSDPRAAKELLLLRVEMRMLSFARARAAVSSMELTRGERLRFERALVEMLAGMSSSAARKAAADVEWLPETGRRAAAILTDLEIRSAMRPLLRHYRPGVDPEPPYHIAYDLFRRGKIPSDVPSVNVAYWYAVLQAARARGDLATFETAWNRIRPGVAEDRELLERLRRQLEELRSGSRTKPHPLPPKKKGRP